MRLKYLMMAAVLGTSACAEEPKPSDHIGLTYVGIQTRSFAQQTGFVENGSDAEFQMTDIDVAVFSNERTMIYMGCEELSRNIIMTTIKKYPKPFIDDLKRADTDLNCPRLTI